MTKLKLPQAFALLAVISLSACSSNSGSNAANDQAAVFEESHVTVVAPLADESNSIAITDGAVEYMRIKHHMAECEGFEVSLCLLAQRAGHDEWTNFYEQIEGFDYQWGTDYEILVHVRTNEVGLPDVSLQQYSLIEVISETTHEAGLPFSYTSRNSHERIVELAPGMYTLLGNKAFTCTDTSCDALRSAMDQHQSTVLSFHHNTNAAEPLVLDAILCSDAATSFSTACL